MTEDTNNNLKASEEVRASSFNGYLMLLVLLVGILWMGMSLMPLITNDLRARTAE